MVFTFSSFVKMPQKKRPTQSVSDRRYILPKTANGLFQIQLRAFLAFKIASHSLLTHRNPLSISRRIGENAKSVSNAKRSTTEPNKAASSAVRKIGASLFRVGGNWREGTGLMGAMRPQTPHRSPRQAFGGNMGMVAWEKDVEAGSEFCLEEEKG
jgi:hypothetical protein